MSGDRAVVGAFATLCLCWGSTFAPLKVVASTLPPVLAAGMRFAVAGGVLLAWALARHRRVRLSAGDVARLAAPAALAIAANYGLMAWGIRRTPSGVGAVVNLAVVPLSAWTFGVVPQHDTFTASTLGGLALGASGLALLSRAPARERRGRWDARYRARLRLLRVGHGPLRANRPPPSGH